MSIYTYFGTTSSYCKQNVIAEHRPYLLSHKAVLKLAFTHIATPLLQFTPLVFTPSVKPQTRYSFDKGHFAPSAEHTHEQKLIIMNSNTDTETWVELVDRVSNLNIQDINFFVQWCTKSCGKEDGAKIFSMM